EQLCLSSAPIAEAELAANTARLLWADGRLTSEDLVTQEALGLAVSKEILLAGIRLGWPSTASVTSLLAPGDSRPRSPALEIMREGGVEERGWSWLARRISGLEGELLDATPARMSGGLRIGVLVVTDR